MKNKSKFFAEESFKMFSRKIIFSFLLLLSLILTQHAKSQCLSGNYTIGGGTANYPDFTSAVAALTSNGICGPVYFLVYPGTYTEQISIGSIAGTNDSTRITFEAINGVNTSVLLNYPSSAAVTNNHVVELAGANYIEFKKISIQRTGSNSYARVVLLTGGACNNKFTTCIIEGKTSAMYTPDMNDALVYSGIGIDSMNVFKYNTFLYGSCALYFTGGTSAIHENGNDASFNTFNDQRGKAISYKYQDNVNITMNVITQDTSYNNGALLFQYSSGNLFIARNRIITGGSGIEMQYCYPSTGKTVSVNSNMFSTLMGGIFVYNCSNVYIEANSVRQSTNNYCFYSSNVSNISLKNNILYNCGGGKVLAITSNVNSDYNNLYTSAAFFGEYNGTNINGTLSNWKAASGKDQNSTSSVPPFFSSTDLHIAYDNKLKDLGIAGISIIDLDLDFTDSTPDIGADQFTLPQYDGSVAKVDSICATNCAGNQNIYITIKNAGTATLNSAMVGWMVNGVVQPSYLFTDTLSSLQEKSMVDIGSYGFTYNQSHQIKIWIGSPNGQTDVGPLNDTIIYVYTPTSMSGTFTIGGVSPDYATIPLAIADMNARTICGPVVFNIRNGTYTQSLNLGNIPGSSVVNTITFQSESGDSSQVTIYGPWITGSNYRFIKIGFAYNPNSNSSYDLIMAGGNNLLFSNCLMIATVPGATFGNRCVYDMGMGSSYTNNRMVDGLTGIEFYQGGNNLISGNVMTGQQVCAIRSHAGNTIIKNNHITMSTTMVVAPPKGIWLTYNGGIAPVITHNVITSNNTNYGYIYLDALSTTGLSSSNRALIANNMVSGVYAITGIYVQLNYTLVYHNTILIPSGTNNLNTSALYVNALGTIVRNNICVNRSNGYAAGHLGAISDNNCFYSNSTIHLISHAGNSYSSLTAFQSAFPSLEQNSYMFNPSFVSNTDLHINSASVISNAGVNISAVTDDIDGDARHLITPDIGADENSLFFQRDINGIDVSLHQVNICSIPMPVYMRFNNIGASVITTATLEWKINGVNQPPVTWTGTLMPGDTAANVLLGYYTFNRSTNYTVYAWTASPNGLPDNNGGNDTTTLQNLAAIPDIILNPPANYLCAGQPFPLDAVNISGINYSWTPTPVFNNTAIADPVGTFSVPTTCILTISDPATGCAVTDSFSVQIFPNCCLSGIYTIGGTNPDFPTFADLNQVLQVATVCGPVIFNVRDGVYTDTLSVPAMAGVSAVNTITIQAESGDSSLARLQSYLPPNRAVLTVLADYVTVQNFGMRGIGGDGYCVAYKGNAGRFLLQNCKLDRTIGNISGALVYVTNDSVVLRKNYVKVSATGLAAQNSIPSPSASGIYIYDNYVDGTNYLSSYYGIYLGDMYAPIAYNNEIKNFSYGIYCSGISGPGRVYSNIIHSIGYVGISYSLDYNQSDTMRLYNNLINMNYSMATAGISIANSSNVEIINNTVSNKGNAVLSSTLSLYNSSNIKCYNNIFEAGNLYTFYIRPTTTSLYNFDHNIYNYSGSHIGIWGPSGADTILDLLTFSSVTGYEANGLIANPQFVSTTDLHIGNSSSLAIDNGKVFSWMTTDIDKENRIGFPDIGADEFNIATLSTSQIIEPPRLLVFPVPASNWIRITADKEIAGSMIEIYNVEGKLVLTTKCENNSLIQLNNFSPGIYLLKAGEYRARIIVAEE